MKREKWKNNTRTHLKKSLRSTKEIKYVNKNNFACNVIINKRERIYADIVLRLCFLFSLQWQANKINSIMIKNILRNYPSLKQQQQ